MKNVIITILAMLVLGLGWYLVYDKAIKKEEVKEIEVIKEVTKTILPVSDNNGIPYINLDGFNESNKEIEDYSKGTSEYDISEYGYSYGVKKNILFLNIFRSCTYKTGAGATVSDYLNFYIDLDNNKLLTVKEVLNKLNISANEISKNFKDVYNPYKVDIQDYIDSNDLTLVPTIGSILFIGPVRTFDAFTISVN